MPTQRRRLVIVGGGPAALAPLIAASRDGRLDALLDAGVVVIERSDAIGSGRIGHYAITSDSTAETFMSACTGHIDPRLNVVQHSPLGRSLAGGGRNAIPLEQAGSLMRSIGEVLHRAVAESRGGAVLTRHEAVSTTQQANGSWVTRVRRVSDSVEFDLDSDHVVLATGGDQSPDRLRTELIGGRPLLPRHDGKVVWSDHILRPEGLADAYSRLNGQPAPRIAIVGGSTSALATAALLMRAWPDQTGLPDSITILHRRPLRIFYPSQAAALADGYSEFTSDDICPLSGFVYRLGGFRLESRDLLLRLRRINNRPPEPRCRLHRIENGDDPTTQQILERADLIVAALGYRPRALPVFDVMRARVALQGTSSAAPLVDERCRVISAEGRPIKNLFSIGLASGFVPRGQFGGEPSFVGQANGLWLWQNGVGALIVDQILSSMASAPPVSEDLVGAAA